MPDGILFVEKQKVPHVVTLERDNNLELKLKSVPGERDIIKENSETIMLVNPNLVATI